MSDKENIEFTKEKIDEMLIAVTVMQDHIEGAAIEVNNVLLTGKDHWCPCKYPDWDWNDKNFRVKAERKIRPYTVDECPLDTDVASKASGEIFTIAFKGLVYVIISNLNSRGEIRYDELLTEYSYIGGCPCGVEVTE